MRSEIKFVGFDSSDVADFREAVLPVLLWTRAAILRGDALDAGHSAAETIRAARRCGWISDDCERISSIAKLQN